MASAALDAGLTYFGFGFLVASYWQSTWGLMDLYATASPAAAAALGLPAWALALLLQSARFSERGAALGRGAQWSRTAVDGVVAIAVWRLIWYANDAAFVDAPCGAYGSAACSILIGALATETVGGGLDHSLAAPMAIVADADGGAGPREWPCGMAPGALPQALQSVPVLRGRARAEGKAVGRGALLAAALSVLTTASSVTLWRGVWALTDAACASLGAGTYGGALLSMAAGGASYTAAVRWSAARGAGESRAAAAALRAVAFVAGLQVWRGWWLLLADAGARAALAPAGGGGASGQAATQLVMHLLSVLVLTDLRLFRSVVGTPCLLAHRAAEDLPQSLEGWHPYDARFRVPLLLRDHFAGAPKGADRGGVGDSGGAVDAA